MWCRRHALGPGQVTEIMTVTPGTAPACTWIMRTLVALVVFGGCVGAGATGGGSRPGVMPMLSELPGDPAKRDAVLDSASTTPTPEQRKGMTGKERKAETAAATAAAILGSMFSHTQTVTLGTSSMFDEGQIAAPVVVVPPQPPSTEAGDGAAKPDAPPADDPATSNKDLIPWIKLK
jgi:hypothetical protein